MDQRINGLEFFFEGGQLHPLKKNPPLRVNDLLRPEVRLQGLRLEVSLQHGLQPLRGNGLTTSARKLRLQGQLREERHGQSW